MIVRNKQLQKKWFRQIASLKCLLLAVMATAVPVAVQATAIADIRSAAEQHVLGRLQESALLDGAEEYTVEVGQLDSRMQLATCSQPLQAAVHGQWPSSQPMVKVSCTGPSPWALYVPVTVTVYHLVATAATPISRGQALDGASVALQKQNIMATHGRFYRNTEEVVGQMAKRHLSPGEALGAHNLDTPKAIKRGDDVVISASSGPIAVKMPAVAMSDGRIGQRISVKNSASQRIIRATVIAPGQVAAAM
jgi:flagellar basal body P-ring formation protein FlgA